MRGAAHRRSFSLRAPWRISLALIAAAMILSGGADSQAAQTSDGPSAPILSLAKADQTSLTISWLASAGPQPIKAYRLSLDGAVYGWTDSLEGTLGGLKCGSTHTVEVEAVDAAWAFSAKGSLTASTAACAVSGTTSGATSGVLSTPILSLVKADQTSLTISWRESVGPQKIRAYRYYLDGAALGSTESLQMTFGGLRCGSTHAVQVEAIDTASALSGRGGLSASTAACAASGTPTAGSGQGLPPQTGSSGSGQTGGGGQQSSGGAGSGSRLYVRIKGSDKKPCTSDAPCATFDRAYRLARPGQVVEVGAGTYPAQSISADSSKASATADVVFQPAAGAQVRILGVLVFGSHVELRNMQMDWEVKPGANGVTFRNIKADGPVSITGASNVSVLGGEIYSPDPVREDSQIASLRGLVPRNILFDGVSFHDFQDVGPGQLHHIECLQVGAAINLTIRNSSFRNCATHDIFIRSWGYENNSPYPLSNIVIENNWLAQTTSGYYAMQVMDDLWTGSPATSFFILNNTAQQSILLRISHGKAQVRGNALPSMSAFFCNSYGQQQWFDYNTYATGVPCGPHDKVTGSNG